MRLVYSQRDDAKPGVTWPIPVQTDRRNYSAFVLLIAGAGGLVNAFDAKDAGDFANIGKNRLELAAVHNFEAGVNAGIGAIRLAFEIANVGAGAADDSSDFREKAGPVFRANHQLNREGGGSCPTPLHGNAALRLIEQILHVRTELVVDGDTAATRDVADDVVPRNGIAAFRAEDEQVVVSFDNERSFAHAEHPFDGLDDSRLVVFRFGFRGFGAFPQNLGQHLARRIFSETDRGEKIVDFGQAVIGRDFLQIFFGNSLQRFAKRPRFFFQQAPAHIGGFFALMEIDPVADFASRVRGLGEAEPIAAGRVPFLRENFDYVAVGDFVAQRDHLPVHFCADALVADFRVHRVRKINGSGASSQFNHAAFGSEGVDFGRGEVNLEGI